MKTYSFSLPFIGLISGTRAIAGSGLALLLADKLKDKQQRHAIGWTLLGIGLLTTVPILAMIVNNSRKSSDSEAIKL